MDDFTPFSANADSVGPSKAISGANTGVDIDELKERVTRLSLICEALWEILKEKNALPADLLNLKVAEIDLTDGKLNGRKANTISTCRKCNRVLSPNRQTCLYCGEFSEHASVFNGFV
ncbi:MAG TPA: hypothetical protein VL357_09890 [Rariglobus sp.]|jgi:hypothetical protein|nr:hypothetical protein [Rariglobus sp.]